MNYEPTPIPEPQPPLTQQEHVFRRSLDAYLDAAIPHGNVSVAMLCIALGTSATPLQRMVRRVTGMTVTAYVAHRRLDLAYRLVTTTSLPLSDVASACGFNSFSYFSTSFRNGLGILPTRLRHKA